MKVFFEDNPVRLNLHKFQPIQHLRLILDVDDIAINLREVIFDDTVKIKQEALADSLEQLACQMLRGRLVVYNGDEAFIVTPGKLIRATLVFYAKDGEEHIIIPRNHEEYDKTPEQGTSDSETANLAPRNPLEDSFENGATAESEEETSRDCTTEDYSEGICIGPDERDDYNFDDTYDEDEDEDDVEDEVEDDEVASEDIDGEDPDIQRETTWAFDPKTGTVVSSEPGWTF